MNHDGPKKAVWYPAAFILVAIPVMLRGIAANPDTGSAGFEMDGAAFSTFTWTGRRPDCRLDREGLQNLNTAGGGKVVQKRYIMPAINGLP